MAADARLLIYSAILAWLMLLVASMLRSRGWTSGGAAVAFGNRDRVPEPSPVAGRADRAAKNMLENLLLFVALVVAAHLGDAAQDRIDLGARIFFYARVAYFAVYLAGIPYLRTAVWLVSIVGLGLIGAAAL